MPISHQDQHIRVAVDAIIYTVDRGELKALLIQMKKKPYEDEWAFPGGLIADSERSEDAAKRILKEQTQVKDVYLEQLATFDEPKRDPLGRVLSVAYFALVPHQGVELKTTDRYKDVRWWPVSKLPRLAYDHGTIAKAALQRLRFKLEYTNVVWSLLPEHFTLTELQQVYEIIMGKEFDKRNFRKKILSLKMIMATGKKRKGGVHRPAELYRFKERSFKYVEVL